MADYSEVGGENVNVLKALINGEEYEGPITSRNSAIIKSIIDNTEYTDEAKSEIEALLLQLKEKGLGNGNIIQTPRYQLYHEDYIEVISNYDNSINISWNDGVYVGCSLNGIMDLSDMGFTKLKYDITFGSKCYDSEAGQNIRPFVIGVADQIFNQYVYVSQDTAPSYFQAYDLYDVNYLNQNVVGEIDISNVEGAFYLLVVATGWNVTINSLELE